MSQFSLEFKKNFYHTYDMRFHKNWQFITMKARYSQKIFSPSPYYNFENLQPPAEHTPTENPAREGRGDIPSFLIK